MFNELTQFYKIGKELGLKRSEINRIFLSSGKHSLLYKFTRVVLFAMLAVAIVLAVVVVSKNIYPSGTLYSSVKLKDFTNKK